MKKFKEFVALHPFVAMFFSWATLYVALYVVKRTTNPLYSLAGVVIVFAILAPFIFIKRIKLFIREESNYLANQIAKEIIEQSKADPKEKYRKFREEQPQSYEEWKEQKEKEAQEKQEIED